MVYTCVKYQDKLHLNNQYRLKKWKTGKEDRSCSRVSVGGKRANKRVKEGEYGGCTLYMCMKIKQWTWWNSSKKGGGEMKENDGESESN
jgi:hypothetical protein